MSRQHTPELIAQTRQVTASAVLEGRTDLRFYPYRHLAVVSDSGLGGTKLANAMIAIEHLDQYGWELVTLTQSTDQRSYIAVVRRKS